MTEWPTPDEQAMNLAEHLDSLKEYFSGKLPEGNRATPIRGFYHVAGHVAAIRRALHAEERVKELEASVQMLEEALRNVADIGERLCEERELGVDWHNYFQHLRA